MRRAAFLPYEVFAAINRKTCRFESCPDCNVENEKVLEIQNKFNAFKSWALNQTELL